jgi:hypothetical protein
MLAINRSGNHELYEVWSSLAVGQAELEAPVLDVVTKQMDIAAAQRAQPLGVRDGLAQARRGAPGAQQFFGFDFSCPWSWAHGNATLAVAQHNRSA